MVSLFRTSPINGDDLVVIFKAFFPGVFCWIKSYARNAIKIC